MEHHGNTSVGKVGKVGSHKTSISLTDELFYAIEAIAIAKRMDRSRVIETFIREHPLVKKEIELIRAEPEHGGFVASPRLAAKAKITAASS